MSAAKDVLVKARVALVEKGWGQGAYQNEQTGCLCSYGALFVGAWGKVDSEGASFDDMGAYYTARLALRAAIREVTPPGLSDIIDFNDTPGRTAEEVLAVFDKAIELVKGVTT